MAELISIRECARRIGVSDTAIRKAIAAGRVSVAGHHEGNGRPLLNFEDVLQNWRANTDPAMQRSTPAGKSGTVKASSLVSDIGGAPLHPMRPGPRGGALKTGGEPRAPRLPDDDGEESASAGGIPAYNESRAVREYYAAQNERLKHEEGAGLLVSAEQVKAEAFGFARKLRDAIMAVPDRIDAELAAETNSRKLNLRLKAELIKALEMLQHDDEVKAAA